MACRVRVSQTKPADTDYVPPPPHHNPVPPPPRPAGTTPVSKSLSITLLASRSTAVPQNPNPQHVRICTQLSISTHPCWQVMAFDHPQSTNADASTSLGSFYHRPIDIQHVLTEAALLFSAHPKPTLTSFLPPCTQ